MVSVCLAWILGIYLGSLVLSPLCLLLLSLCPIPLLAVLVWRGWNGALWGGLCLVVLLGGVACYQWKFTEPTLEHFNDRGMVIIRGEVVRDPDAENGVARITLSAEEVWADGQWRRVSGRVLV